MTGTVHKKTVSVFSVRSAYEKIYNSLSYNYDYVFFGL